jgi:hypothetical protein
MRKYRQTITVNVQLKKSRLLLLMLIFNFNIGLISCTSGEQKLEDVTPVRCNLDDPISRPLDSFKNLVFVRDSPVAISPSEELTFKSVSEDEKKVEFSVKQRFQNPYELFFKLDSPIIFIGGLGYGGVWLRNLKISDLNLTADVGDGLLHEMAFDKPKVDIAFGIESKLIAGQQYNFLNSIIYYAGHQFSLAETKATAPYRYDIFVVTTNSSEGKVCWREVLVAYGDLAPVNFWAGDSPGNGNYYSLTMTQTNGFLIDEKVD